MSAITEIKKSIHVKGLAIFALLLGSILVVCAQKDWSVFGVFCGMFFVFFYAFVVFATWKECGVIEELKAGSKKELLGILLLIILANICMISVLLKEKYVHYFDYAGYWAKVITMSNWVVDNPKQMLVSLYESINNENYNNLIPCIMALPIKIFGANFTMYATIIFNMFIVPTFITVIFSVKRITEKLDIKFHVILVSGAVILMPMFWQPVVYGYLDGFALLNLSLLYLMLVSDIFENLTVKRDLLVVAAILLCLMGRRYFAYAIIGLVLCVVIVCLKKLIVKKQVAVLKHYIFHGIVIAGSFFFVIFLGFWQFLQQSFSGTVAVDTAAYQKGGLLLNYQLCLGRYGYLYMAVALLGCGYMIYKKKSRIHGICLLAGFFSSTFLFYGMQSMNMHHYYITLIPVTIAIAVGLSFLSKKQLGKYCAVLILILNTAVFMDSVKIEGTFAKAFTEVKIVPKCRNDIAELQAMAKDVKEEAAQGHTTYVLASSDILNDDILRRVNMPDEVKITSQLLGTNHVDLRHGFPEQFLDADIVLVASPAQYHLQAENQHVIIDLANEFLNEGILLENYEKINSYQLDNDVEVFMYRRIREIPESHKEYLREMFQKYYEDYPELFYDRIK